MTPPPFASPSVQMLREDVGGDEELSGSSADHCGGRVPRPGSRTQARPSPAGACVQVLLYDPLFDWTMNPLKAFYLQRDEQQELNATLGSTVGGEDAESRKFRCADG